MPRISNITWTKMNIRYGWLFDIRSFGGLFDYLDNVRVPHAKEEFSHAIKAAKGEMHDNIVSLIARTKGISIIDAQLKLNNDILSGMKKSLEESKQIFVNTNGGYFTIHDGLKIIKTREIDIWVLPEEKPRFLQWPGGEHWYAKIGDEDIVVDGLQKWNTKAEAEKATEKFLKGKRH